MSTTPESDLDLDLHFLPAWAKSPADQNRYADYVGRPEREETRGDRPRRRFDGGGPRRDRPAGGSRPPQNRSDRGPSQQGRGGKGPHRSHEGRRDQGDRRFAPPPPPAPLPEIV